MTKKPKIKGAAEVRVASVHMYQYVAEREAARLRKRGYMVVVKFEGYTSMLFRGWNVYRMRQVWTVYVGITTGQLVLEELRR